MTVDDLIANAESRLRSTKRDHDESKQRLTGLQRQIEDGHDYDQADVDAAISRHASLTDQIDAIRGELDQLRADKVRDLEVAAMQQQSTPTTVTRGGQSMNQTGKTFVVAEPSQYTANDERDGRPSFLRDLYSSMVKNDPQAGERLSRHGREVQATRDLSERAGVTTSTVASFVPPQYLVDLFADFARAARPTANLMTSIPLPPSGMSVTIPKITTESTTAIQSTQNTEVSNQDVADTGITLTVQTIAGYNLVSRQTLERGVLAEEMIFADLASAYAAQLDALVLGAALDQTGTNAVTFTDNTSPTVIECWPKLADAAGKVRSQRYSGPTAFVMHPRRWSWMQSELSATFPLVGGSAGAVNIATETNPQYGASVGTMLGVPVVLDANIPTTLGAATNEDVIFVGDFRDSVLLEEPSKAPMQLRFDSVEPQNLSVHLVAYGYAAYTFARQPAALSKITGSGLVVPTL